MRRTPTPLDLWTTGLELTLLAAETQAVMAMRLWGMAGLWNVTPHENTRMVSEKASAITQSAMNTGFAALSGKRADEVVTVAVKPLRKKTRSNARRLIKRGPKLS